MTHHRVCFDMFQEEEDVKNLDASAGTNSTLSTPIQQLIRMIFDVESMKAAMLEFEVCVYVLCVAILFL